MGQVRAATHPCSTCFWQNVDARLELRPEPKGSGDQALLMPEVVVASSQFSVSMAYGVSVTALPSGVMSGALGAIPQLRAWPVTASSTICALLPVSEPFPSPNPVTVK